MADTTLDELVIKFTETKDGQDFARMMDILEKSMVFIPALMPKAMSQEAKAAARAGKPLPIDPKNQPQVCLLGQEGGEKVFPIFTSREQIPREKMPPVIMNAPFKAVIAMVKGNQSRVGKIVVNPFTHGVVLNEKLVDMADKRLKVQSGEGIKTVQVTEKQFHTIVHTKVARQGLANAFLKEPEKAISDLRLKKEQMVLEAYKREYSQGVACPYTEDDLAVMLLQIDDGLLLARIDLPEANLVAGSPAKVYITCEKENLVRYFIIEKRSKEAPGNIAEMTSEGGYNILMPAPDNGAEIETVISLIRPS